MFPLNAMIYRFTKRSSRHHDVHIPQARQLSIARENCFFDTPRTFEGRNLNFGRLTVTVNTYALQQQQITTIEAVWVSLESINTDGQCPHSRNHSLRRQCTTYSMNDDGNSHYLRVGLGQNLQVGQYHAYAKHTGTDIFSVNLPGSTL